MLLDKVIHAPRDLSRFVRARLRGDRAEPNAPLPPLGGNWDALAADQLTPTRKTLRAAAIFQRAVRMVEIEVFSYCNRRCWFCPNATIDRISKNIYMPPIRLAA